MHTRPLVLASASPRRRELLARLGRSFEVLPAAVDESMQPDETPQGYALRLARDKARAAGRLTGPGPLVVGADTIVVHRGRVLGKPAEAGQARAFLLGLRARAHEVATAVAVLDTVDQVLLCGLERTLVWMRRYDEHEIDAYIASADPFDKAGAYAIQSPTFRPVLALRGSYTNVVGLPLGLVAGLLTSLIDVAPCAAPPARADSDPRAGLRSCPGP